MLTPGELRERLRYRLLPVPEWLEEVRQATGWTEPKARALLGALEAAGKVVTFPDPDGVERVAVVGNWTPPDAEQRP